MRPYSPTGLIASMDIFTNLKGHIARGDGGCPVYVYVSGAGY